MRIHKPLLALLGTSCLSLGDFTQVDALWTANQTFAMPIVDNGDTRLQGGDLVQVGYFTAVDLNKDPANFTAADWNSFKPLTGDGSANPDILTFIDFGIPGFISFSAPFNTDIHSMVPNSDVRVGLKIFDAPTVAAANNFNLVSASGDGWIMKMPGSGQNVPFPARADLDVAQAGGTISWLGTPFKTDLVPGPAPATLTLTDVTLVNATTLEISWSGGDGSNNIQTSTNGENFSNVMTGASSPAQITVNPTGVTKLLVRVVEP